RYESVPVWSFHREYIRKLQTGTLSYLEILRLEIPYSPQLIRAVWSEDEEGLLHSRRRASCRGDETRAERPHRRRAAGRGHCHLRLEIGGFQGRVRADYLQHQGGQGARR